LPEEEIRAVLQRGLIKVTDNTITDPVRLRKEIDEIRKRGYAYSDQEFIPGARAVAAPVFDGAVAVVASLTLSAPIPRLGVPNRERVAHCVIKAAQEVSTSLGWRPD